MKTLLAISAYIILIGGCVSGQKTATSSSSASESSTAATSSKSVANKNIEYIIFGRYSGRCITANCSPMYKLDLVKKELTLDNSSHYSQGAELTFTQKLSEEQFQMVETLPARIPDSLFSSMEERFGCPNCADQGGIHLAIKIGEKKYSFEIDTRIDAVNPFLRSFAEEVSGIVSRLRERNK